MQGSVLGSDFRHFISEPGLGQSAQGRRFPNALTTFQDQATVCFAAGFEDTGNRGDHPARADGLGVWRRRGAQVIGQPSRQAVGAVPGQALHVLAHGVECLLARHRLNGQTRRLDGHEDTLMVQPLGGPDVIVWQPWARDLSVHLVHQMRWSLLDHGQLCKLITRQHPRPLRRPSECGDRIGEHGADTAVLIEQKRLPPLRGIGDWLGLLAIPGRLGRVMVPPPAGLAPTGLIDLDHLQLLTQRCDRSPILADAALDQTEVPLLFKRRQATDLGEHRLERAAQVSIRRLLR